MSRTTMPRAAGAPRPMNDIDNRGHCSRTMTVARRRAEVRP
jgi:hypothetical protein